ncbi:hypothetical protein [Parabacteroides chinchillae]|uniref:hypothetical protein n=1 Tax=Parabacteroides chinchillae TaxID=871327 RepID=UPI000CDF03FB|nr:hypothetical protein [Parabacteroides chinchillae]
MKIINPAIIPIITDKTLQNNALSTQRKGNNERVNAREKLKMSQWQMSLKILPRNANNGRPSCLPMTTGRLRLAANQHLAFVL